MIAIGSLVFFNDTWGLVWWLIAATLLVRSKNPLLLSACFIYTMPLEWVGTAIGNWVWVADVPYVGLTSANPPSGVGVLYILLDLITVLVSSGRFVNEIETARGIASPLGSPVACAESET